MSTPKKLVVITSATGSQGISIVKHLLQHHKTQYNVRALTRNTSSTQALSLSALGAEVVSADFDDESSLTNAFAGANVIFANTNFWESLSLEKEVLQGLAIAAAAAKTESLENFIYSGLGDARILFGGKYQGNLPYNAKSIVLEEIAARYPSVARVMTVVTIGFYMENWLKYQAAFGPTKIGDGIYELAMPYSGDHKIVLTATSDVGVLIAAIIGRGKELHDKKVSLVTNFQTDEEKLRVWAKELNVQATFKHLSAKEYRDKLEAMGFPAHIAESTTELTSMVGEGINYLEGDGIINGRDIVDPEYKFKTWEEYVKEEDWSSIL